MFEDNNATKSSKAFMLPWLTIFPVELFLEKFNLLFKKSWLLIVPVVATIEPTLRVDDGPK